jgi:hypothetical protein
LPGLTLFFPPHRLWVLRPTPGKWGGAALETFLTALGDFFV